jgi:hypothetical protein
MWHLQDIIHVKSRRNCGAFCDKWWWAQLVAQWTEAQ